MPSPGRAQQGPSPRAPRLVPKEFTAVSATRPRDVLEALRQDARLAHQLTYRDRTPTWGTWARVLLSSGLHVLATTRAMFAWNAWQPQGQPARVVKEAVRIAMLLTWRVSSMVSRSEITVAPELEGGIYLSP